MAPSFDLSHLDPENLTKFIDGTTSADGTSEGVQGVIDALVELQTDLDDASVDGDEVMSMLTLSNALATPGSPFGKGSLQIGLLNKEGPLAGGVLLTFVKGAAGSIHPVETAQEQLFRDIQSNLRDTIAEMKKAQLDSLAKVEAETFLNDLHNVEDDLTTRPATA
ncbi:type VII secretion system-associated protein [Streptomyces sp. NPDC014734]|uniref:type VII secretion system-associated protein n=1 Tax=Streptomyces sp. NPDC014734 TaxID=3364886 RepID=UPI00370185A3